MINDLIFNEFKCLNCNHLGLKRLVKEWKDEVITSFFDDWYFCPNCGYHMPIRYKDDKMVA
jgi:hypothetical protein